MKYETNKIRTAYEQARQRSLAERQQFERLWLKNVLFFIGLHWIQWNSANNRWQPARLKKWIPRPTTNKFSAAANTIMQVLSSKAPELSPQPQTDNEDDIASAEIAERLLPVLDDESDVRTSRKLASFWITLTGNCFLHPCYDADMQQGSTFIQHLRCQTCGKVTPPDDVGEGICPACQSPNLTEAYTPKGEPIGEEMPRGNFPVEVFSPFEIFLDLEARSMQEVQEILVRRRYPVEKIRQQFRLPDGGEIQPDSPGSAGQGGVGLNYLRSIAYAATGAGYPSAYGLGVTAAEQQGVTVDYFWKRPTSDFPKGLCVPFANDQILERQSKEYDSKYEIPYKDKAGIPIWPWHQLIFDRVGGRIYGRTPMDDVAPKQEQRNKLESLILLIASRMSVPHWLIGKNTGITTITGDPGQVIEWNSMLGNAAKPELLQGAGVPTSLVALLEKIDTDIEQLAGVFDVLRGNAPPGVSAGTALRLLLERAVTRFTPVIEEFEYVWGRVQRDRLIMFQQFGTDERMAKIQGPGKTWEIQRFNNSDLRGCVDVKVEAGSMLPKSAVGQQALIQDMAAMGVIVPQEPETQYKILQQFGATHLLGPRDENIKQAERENWRFVHDNIQPQINPVIDDHETHWNVHLKLALTSDFETWPDEMKITWLNHMQQHKDAIIAAMMPAMAQQAGTPAGPNGARGNGSNGSSRRGPASAAQEDANPEAGPVLPGGAM
jgi:hypothetical protein